MVILYGAKTTQNWYHHLIPLNLQIGKLLGQNPPEVQVTSGQKPSTEIIYII